jgi:N-methylhydantoinase A
VTDASLLLGYFDPARFLGGRRRLYVAGAAAANARLAAALGLDPIEAAAGVHRLVNARMAERFGVASIRDASPSSPSAAPPICTSLRSLPSSASHA